MREKHFLFFFPQTIDKTATKLIDDKHYDSEEIAAIRDEVCASACLCTQARENVGALLTMVGSRSQASIFYFSDREFVYVFCSCWSDGTIYEKGLPLDADCWRIHSFCSNCIRTQMT